MEKQIDHVPLNSLSLCTAFQYFACSFGKNSIQPSDNHEKVGLPLDGVCRASILGGEICGLFRIEEQLQQVAVCCVVVGSRGRV